VTPHDVLVAVRLGVVAAGVVSSAWSLRLGLRSREHLATYVLLASGLALIALAAVVEGVLFEFAGWDLAGAHTAEALISAAGFVLILVSILRSRV